MAIKVFVMAVGGQTDTDEIADAMLELVTSHHATVMDPEWVPDVDTVSDAYGTRVDIILIEP